MATEIEIATQAIRGSIREKLDQSELGPFASYHNFLVPTHLVQKWHEDCDIQSAYRDVLLEPYSKLDFTFVSPESDSRASFWRTPIGSLLFPPERGWQELSLFVQLANQNYDQIHYDFAHKLVMENGTEPKVKVVASRGRFLDRTKSMNPSLKDLEHWKILVDNAMDYNLNPFKGFGLPIVGQSK